MKIIIGAGNTSHDGWISTQESELNLLNREDFLKRFEERSIEAILAEHVWEHMTEQAGFDVELLEYCDENGNFLYKYWNETDGKIGRSFRYDTRNSLEKIGMASIIIDAKKPLIIHKN